MAASDKLKTLVNEIPDPDKNGTYANLDAAKIERIDKVLRELRKGGSQAVGELIDLLVEPGKGDDVKAHFALHRLAVGLTETFDDPARAAFARTLASQIHSDRPKGVRMYLIEQLQVAGGKEVVGELGKALLDEDLCDLAARALAAIGEGAVEQLLAAEAKVTGPSRLSVVKKLAVLRATKAAGVFRKALTDPDADVRIAAGLALARIADASAGEAMLRAVAAAKGWERINLADACMVLAENLQAAGKKAAAATLYAGIQKTCTDKSENHLRQAAAKALAPNK